MHPIIKNVGKEAAFMNIMLPQTGVSFHNIGEGAVMFLEHYKSGLSWNEFFSEVPEERFPNPYIIKGYLTMHKAHGLGTKEITQERFQGSLFTYPSIVDVSLAINSGLLSYLTYWSEDTLPCITGRTYADKGAPAVKELVPEALDAFINTDKYTQFMFLIERVHTTLHGKKFIDAGTLVRESIGNKGLKNYNYKDRLARVASERETIERTLRQVGPYADALRELNLENLIEYYDQENLFDGRYDFSSAILRSMWDYLTDEVLEEAANAEVPSNVALRIFNLFRNPYIEE